MSYKELDVEEQIDWFAVDWGTSQLRVWGLTSVGKVLFQTSSDKGAGTLQQHEFEGALQKIISQQIPNKLEVPVIICGMAGSRQGWKEAQYVKMPTESSQIFQGVLTVKVENQRLKVYIIPGLCQQEIDNPDVIRGEETQLIGLINSTINFTGTACLPGTHSKWVNIENGKICSSQTYLTGEIFALLRKYSMLRHSIECEERDENSGFQDGVARAMNDSTSVISDFFSIRARQLLFDSSKPWSYSYLSGLLIGHEIKHGISQTKKQKVSIIGEQNLVNKYCQAFKFIDVEAEVKNVEEMTLLGLSAAYHYLFGSV